MWRSCSRVVCRFRLGENHVSAATTAPMATTSMPIGFASKAALNASCTAVAALVTELHADWAALTILNEPASCFSAPAALPASEILSIKSNVPWRSSPHRRQSRKWPSVHRKLSSAGRDDIPAFDREQCNGDGFNAPDTSAPFCCAHCPTDCSQPPTVMSTPVKVFNSPAKLCAAELAVRALSLKPKAARPRPPIRKPASPIRR